VRGQENNLIRIKRNFVETLPNGSVNPEHMETLSISAHGSLSNKIRYSK
jgi:hypothetical protein